MRTSHGGPRWARAGALLCSAGLGLFVVVHAQLGCDARTKEPEPTPAATAAPAAPTNAPAAQAQPSEPSPAAEAQPPTPAPTPTELVGTDGGQTPEPVYMPASKSGGDFGAVRFPGEPTPQAPTPDPDAPR